MANETITKLRTRGITGLLFIVVVLALLLYSKYTAALFLAIICVTCSFEYTNITRRQVKDPTFNLSFIAGIAPLITSFIKPEIFEDYGLYFLIGSTFITLIFAFSSILTSIRTNHHLLGPLLIFFYIGVPIACISSLLIFIPDSYEYYTLIGLMFFLWASDTGSYVVGRLIGKTPFHKRISPNKTLEGWLGGIPFVLLFAYLLHLVFNDFSLIQWMVLGLIVWFVGSMGDLFESTIKRQFDIKDSGKGLPGHGGFLDRFDSFLLAAPVYTLIIYLAYNF